MRKRRTFISTAGLICLCIGFIISGLVAFHLYSNESDQIREKFEHDADTHAFAIQQQIAQDIAILHSLKGFFDASDDISRNQFKVMSQVLIERHPSLQAVGWVPHVTSESRSHFEQNARKDALPNFELTERGEWGTMIRAPRRGVYYPVYYIEPNQGNEAALGFDLASDPVRLHALLNARDTGEAQPTRRIQLVQESGSSWAELFFVPLYHGNPNHSPEREKAIRGFISGVFRIRDIMETLPSIREAQPALHFELIDANGDLEELLYETPANDLKLFSNVRYAKRINLSSGRHWILHVVASIQYFKNQRSSFPQLSFIFGIFLSGCLAHYLTRQHRENERITEEVKDQTRALRSRTEDLVSANTQLMHEVAGREKLQQEFATLTDQEQRRLGQELHDSLGQQIAVASMLAHNLQDSIPDSDPYQIQQFESLTQSLTTSQTQIRALSKGLLPVDIGEKGLKTALEALALSIRNLKEYDVNLSCDEGGFSLDISTSTQLYRIAQEAIRNALEHGEANCIDIQLHHADGGLVLVIKDNGAGFNSKTQTSTGSGLRIMRHRAELIGADFSVESISGIGTSVICFLSEASIIKI